LDTALHGRRLDEHDLPTGQLVLEAPPRIEPNDAAGGLLMNAIPVLGSLGSIVLIAGPGRDQGGRGYLAAGLFVVASLGFIGAQLDRQRRQRTRQQHRSRAAYLHYLANARALVREAAGRQRQALCWRHPEPAALASVAAERSRVWERAPSDPSFLHVRYGVCTQPLSLELVPAETAPVDQLDPVSAAARHRLLVVHRRQAGLPASIDLRAFTRVEICGAPDPARALARSLICSAATFHSPEHLAVAVLAPERNLGHWDWVKWLPHRRMVAASPTGPTAPLSSAHDASPHLLLVTDGVAAPDSRHGVTLLDVTDDWDELEDATALRLRLEGEPGADGRPPLIVQRVREEPVTAGADQCTPATAEALARRLAPQHATAGEATRPADLPGLLRLGDLRTLDPPAVWRCRPAGDRLRVPIGLGDDGAVVHLDLKESAQQGMGPHGLVVGATGSGKSELLRTLVLGLALTHSPELLNLVLIDFKGGATFAGLSGLPHVSALITNLARELTLIERMHDALSGELVRRQELLRQAGGFASVRDYEAARADGRHLAPLPSLLVVVDEFSELLSARPEFVDLFVAIGRLGRSLGLHLLLASQRLEEGRLRGLESHLSYRVGLRTFSPAESRAVLGVPDAYELPAVPGLGYLKSDPSTMRRFRAAYVSGPPPAGRTQARPTAGAEPPGVVPFGLAEVPSPPSADAEAPSDGQESLLDVAVRRLTGHGPAARQVWLPPLDRPATLDGLMSDLTADAHLGLVSHRWRGLDGLVVPLGTVDRPREQRRDTLTADLSGAGGHLAVVGGPRSGKSTLLRTVVASLSLTTTPQEVSVYVLDFGGGTFAPLARLPHVAGFGTRSDPDVVRRVVAEVQGIVERREACFRTRGVDSIETYRSRRAAGQVDDGYGDVFLVVDGWSTLRADFDDLEVELHQLATRGSTFGLHVVAGSGRWADFRPAVRDLFGTRLELRLGDPLDSEVDRRAATLVPTGRPGRGLSPGPLHFLAALPRIDGDPGAATLRDGVEDLVARVTAGWTGPRCPRLRLLPERIDLDTVRAQAATASGTADRLLLLGVDERQLAPVGLDADADPHLLVFGDGRSGKSTVLRGYVREVMRTRTSEEAQLVVVDYRRSLLGEVPDAYLLHYLTSATQAQQALDDLAGRLRSRLPGPHVVPEQLRNRSWWTGAEVFTVVDDYDLVATQRGSPVQVLEPLLAQARDTGLHVVVARRSGGASRAVYEPVLQSMRDLAAPGLLLSGSPEEGPLVGGQRPRRAPPGRGRLVSREGDVEVVQLAWSEPRS
jgi:S-DNA-T family DNA segregation ATPase FtsK/SpoIIIE